MGAHLHQQRAADVVANVERKRQAKFVRTDWPRDADLTCRIRVAKTSRICLYNGRPLTATDVARRFYETAFFQMVAWNCGGDPAGNSRLARGGAAGRAVQARTSPLTHGTALLLLLDSKPEEFHSER